MCWDMTRKIIFDCHTNKTRCNRKGFALEYILKLRVSGFGKKPQIEVPLAKPVFDHI